MKVANLFKHRGETISKHHSELVQRMSPMVREYWGEFLNRTHGRQIVAWMKDFQEPAINEDGPIQAPIVLKPAAQVVYDDLSDQIDQVIHTGDWLMVDQNRIDHFGEVTEDMQWIHTDPERAATESPFKTTIAHGFLTLALLPKLTDSVDPSIATYPTAKMVVNVGLNQVRFLYPVKVGNRVRAKSTLIKVTPVRKGLEVEREIKVEIEGIRRPACVVISVTQLHF